MQDGKEGEGGKRGKGTGQPSRKETADEKYWLGCTRWTERVGQDRTR